MYIYKRSEWPKFIWDQQLIAEKLISVKFAQGLLLGKMQNIGLACQDEAQLEVLTTNIIKTSEIEGEHLDPEATRSSVARHLGIDIAGLKSADRVIDGVVEMHLDATQNYDKKLTKTRLCQWHAILFPSGLSGMTLITPGHFRTDQDGPMQVISGAYGRQKVHFQAPPAEILDKEIDKFLKWFNAKFGGDLLIKAAIAHLWFVTLHPFEDGNGRISRAIADMVLSHSDNQKQRYYSMSSQICMERKDYYDKLESTQKSDLDITAWILWFLACLERSLSNADDLMQNVLDKAKFWEQHAGKSLNQRQIDMLNILFTGFKGKLTTSKWAKMMKCSQDTAARDINTLINEGILSKGSQGGRSTNYILKDYSIRFID